MGNPLRALVLGGIALTASALDATLEPSAPPPTVPHEVTVTRGVTVTHVSNGLGRCLEKAGAGDVELVCPPDIARASAVAVAVPASGTVRFTG